MRHHCRKTKRCWGRARDFWPQAYFDNLRHHLFIHWTCWLTSRSFDSGSLERGTSFSFNSWKRGISCSSGFNIRERGTSCYPDNWAISCGSSNCLESCSIFCYHSSCTYGIFLLIFWVIAFGFTFILWEFNFRKIIMFMFRSWMHLIRKWPFNYLLLLGYS